MKGIHKIVIDKPAAEAWKVLADDFDKAAEWMAVVPISYAHQSDPTLPGAPVSGRVCQFSADPDGMYADEMIRAFDAENYYMQMEVVPHNSNLPIQKNVVDIYVKSLGDNHCEVVWETDTELKTVGKILFPAVKLGLAKSFKEILEELKFFVEKGEPHPRKQKQLAKAS